MEFVLPSKTNIIKEDKNLGVFEIEGLYPGYGLTVGMLKLKEYNTNIALFLILKKM